MGCRAATLLALVVLLCGGAAPARAATDRFAFATAIDLGAANGAGQLLGARVLLASLGDLAREHAVHVLVRGTVPPTAARQLEALGGTVTPVAEAAHRPGDGGGLPLLLHAWNLTRYERVIYLAPDTVVTQPAALATLFACGEFCAVFASTPCIPNLGLLVAKPDPVVHARLTSFTRDSPGSVELAQAALTATFPGCAKAALFHPDRPRPWAEVSQLHVTYSMPAIYFAEKRNWDLYRCFVFDAVVGIPAATVSYGWPAAEAMKPWYWWAAWIAPLPGWTAARARLDAPVVTAALILRIALLAAVALGADPAARLLADAAGPQPRWAAHSTGRAPVLGMDSAALHAVKAMVATTAMLGALWLSFQLVPPTCSYAVGWLLFIAGTHVWLRGVFNLLLAAAAPAHARLRWSDLGGSVAAWLLVSCQPAVDDAVADVLGVAWGVHTKVLLIVPPMAALLAAQWWTLQTLRRTLSARD